MGRGKQKTEVRRQNGGLPACPPTPSNLDAETRRRGGTREEESMFSCSSAPPRLRVGFWGTTGLIALALCGCHQAAQKETEAPAPVQVTAVTQDTIRRIVAGDGVLFAFDQQNVMPKISAPVQKFYVNRGDHVKTGQLLAVLENRDLKFTMESNKGQVDQAEANLQATEGATIPESVVKARTDVEADRETADAAKKVLESRQELFKQGALARRQVDEAQVSWAQANSALLTAQEHLRDARGGF